MPKPVPPMTVTLEWDSSLEFTGQAGKHEVGIDGMQYTAPSPMQLFSLSIVGCMAIDIVHVIQKSRKRLVGLEARFTGQRAQEDPKRFTHVDMRFALATDADPELVQRAIQLSRDKYCSVLRSLGSDIEVEVGFTIEEAL
jgi:putative redox protein